MIRALVFFLLLVPAVAAGQTQEELFDSRALHDVRLYVHSSDLRLLRDRYLEDIYVPADFEWRGLRVRNVGVRVRGLATRSAVKPGLRIDFNRYVSGQTFLQMNALILDNALKDASFVREPISMAFIKRMGQPAPRESFARVFINGQLEGLYVLVEAVDDRFLARELGDGSGYLFEHKYAGGFHGEFLGEEYAPYKTRFEAETHRLESDYTLYAPIRELFREINQDVDAVWRERVEWLIDLNQVVTHVAIETFLAEHDGFIGGSGMANFFLYRPIEANRHRLLAWDRDTTFLDIETPLFNRIGDNALMSRALRFRDLRALFLDVLEQCARAASEDRWLESEIYQAQQLIRDAAHEDPRKPFSNEEYDAAIAHVLSFAQQRPAFVLDAVARAR